MGGWEEIASVEDFAIAGGAFDSTGKLWVHSQDGLAVSLDHLRGEKTEILLDLRSMVEDMKREASLHPERKSQFSYLEEADFAKMGLADERGLLGLAFHPTFPDVFYAFYSSPSFDGESDHQSVLASFKKGKDPTETMLTQKIHFRNDEREFNHNGGMIAFGPDGHFYVGIGDGGGFDDMHRPLIDTSDPESFLGNAQNPESPNGKILRFSVSRSGDRLAPAGSSKIQELRPFWNLKRHPAAWHVGLRNPWRFSFDMKTGAMFVADVGQSRVEEVDVARPGDEGLNFGWRAFEGNEPLEKGSKTRQFLRREKIKITPPVITYKHDQGVAVIGGYVRDGKYVFGDYAGPRKDMSGGRIFMADVSRLLEADPQKMSFDLQHVFEGENLHSFAQAPNGEIYAFTVTRVGKGDRVGRVYKMTGWGEGKHHHHHHRGSGELEEEGDEESLFD